MYKRMVVWWAVAGVLVGGLGAAAVAVRMDEGEPARLPSLAAGNEALAARSQGVPAGAPGEVYRVRGELPELASTARAYTVGRGTTDARVARLARAVGLAGPVKSDPDGWTVVGSSDRQLRVERTAGLPWTFGDLTGEEVVCALASPEPGAPPETGADCPQTKAASKPSSGTATAVPACASPPCSGRSEPVPAPRTTLPAELPARGGAEDAARRLLARAGVDLDGAQVDVERGAGAWTVTVEPRVDGHPTSSWATSASIGPQGRVVSASGWLAEPEAADEYPLVRVAAALKRLGAPAVGDNGVQRARAPGLAPVKGGDEAVGTVTGVRLGLLFAQVADRAGRALLVPAYLFTLDQGPVLPVIAVEDRYLGEPRAVPETLPARQP